MKRIISVILILLFLSGTIFAVDTASTTSANEDLFTGINGTELSISDMERVDGEGIATGVAGAIIGGVAGGMYESFRTAIRMFRRRERRSPRRISRDIRSAMIGGAITGSIAAYIPLP